ncbi:MAG: hypothetical protein ACI9SQ_001022 [Rubritalea sp.]|jgi:hypothetical protein
MDKSSLKTVFLYKSLTLLNTSPANFDDHFFGGHFICFPHYMISVDFTLCLTHSLLYSLSKAFFSSY